MPTRLQGKGLPAFLLAHVTDAFNDNAFKFAVQSAILAATVADQQRRGTLLMASQLCFALPFIVLASWAGSLSDRFSKTAVLRATKASEMLVMAAGAAAFLAGDLWLLVGVVLLSSVQSTFFSPAKYGLLAETVDERRLARVNGLANMTMFVASVVGQVAGEQIAVGLAWGPAAGVGLLVGVSFVGVVATFMLPSPPAARPGSRLTLNPLPELRETWRGVRADRPLLYVMAGIAHFYLMAATLQTVLQDYAQQRLGFTTWSAMVVALGVTGMAVGSLLAARWSPGHIEVGLVPFGAAVLSLALLVLPAASGVVVPLLVVLASGIGAGLFLVPLNALLQYRSPSDRKGAYQAFGNVVSFLGIVVSALVLGALNLLELPIGEQLVALGLLSLGGTIVSLWLLPEALLRLVGWLLGHSIYRIRLRHRGNLPARGPALIVVNHVSWVDALVLSVSTRRRIRFLMYRGYFQWAPTRWFFRLVGCIPVASGDTAEALAASLEEAGQQLDEGHVVCVFAEGHLTRTGLMLPLRRGYQRILGGRDVPIVPVHLDGLWGSVFSHEGGKLLWKWPKALPYPVTVSFGPPLVGGAEPHEVAAAIRRQATEAWEARRRSRRPLHVTLLREARRETQGRLADGSGRKLSRGALLARALALRPRLPKGEVAVALPPGIEAATAMLALLLDGRRPVLIDPALVVDDEAGKLGCTLLDTVEGPAGFGWRLLGWLLPGALFERLAVRGERRDLDASAVLVVSASGTLELSHFALLSNVEALLEGMALRPEDRLLAALPWHEPAGLVLGLWLPLLGEVGTTWTAEGDDGGAVSRLVERAELTIAPTSTEQLRGWLRSAKAERLGGLRWLLVVDGPVDAELSAAVEERFGLPPLAAWSSREVGPLLTISAPDVREPGVFQRAHREGTVGLPLPGWSIEVHDADGRLLPPGTAGKLVVVGPGRPFVCEEPSPLEEHAWSPPFSGAIDEEGFVLLRRTGSGGAGATAPG